jgi:hypothetical protein
MSYGANNRKHQRVAIKGDAPTVTVHLQAVTGLQDTRTVKPHDLSRSGMGFTAKDPVKVGTKATILLQHRRRPLRIVGKVTNCRQLEDKQYIIGVKFTSIAQIPVDTPVQGVELTDDPLVDQLMIDV